MRTLVARVLLPLAAGLATVPGAGCGVEDYLVPLTGQFVVVTAIQPGAEYGELPLPAAATVVAQVSEATVTTELSALAVNDARVTLEVSGVAGVFDVPSTGQDGVYQAALSDPTLFHGLDTRVYTVKVVSGDSTGSAKMPMPAAPDFELPDEIPAAQAQSLAISGGPFDALLVVVTDANGEVTYTRYPDSADEFLDLLDGQDATQISLPPESFPDPGQAYAVGIAGLLGAEDNEAFDGLNVAASHLWLGVLRTRATLAI